MRRPALAVSLASLVLLAAVSPSSAQDDFTADALRAGSWSIDFSIEENFQIDSFQGAAISATKHTSERSAWRYGLSFSARMADTDNSRFALTDSTPLPVDIGTDDQSNFSIGIDVLRLLYPDVEGRVRPYLGLGPTIGYSHNKREADIDQSAITGPITHFENKDEIFSAGAQFVLGVEVFAARRVSLVGQYGVSLLYQHQSATFSARRTFPGGSPTPQGEDAEATTDSWRLGENSVRFGVSAYF